MNTTMPKLIKKLIDGDGNELLNTVQFVAQTGEVVIRGDDGQLKSIKVTPPVRWVQVQEVAAPANDPKPIRKEKRNEPANVP